MSLKNPLTPAGIEPATFRFVAQHFENGASVQICYSLYWGVCLLLLLSSELLI